MKQHDLRGIELSTHSRAAADAYDQAVELLAGYYADPLATIDAALGEDPDFVSGHCVRAALGVLALERAGEPLIRESIAAGRRLAGRANERELRHLGAAEAWLAGDFHRSNQLYGEILLEHPRDLLALQVAHIGDFALGQQRELRDRVARILPAWDRSVAGYGFVLGMLAFGLEETNLFELAELTGQEALEQNRRDPWAVHAVAHVYEMTGEVRRGADWLESRAQDWAPNNALAFHNHWHLALFELELGRADRALEIFDRHLWPKPSAVALEMVDAAALLFRLHLRGVDVGARAASVAEAWSDTSYHGYYAFNDAHAVLALVAAGRIGDALRVVAELERLASEASSNGAMVREVGLPFARALTNFGRGRYDEVVDALLPLRHTAQRFGGSNAQRDVIEQTLAEAAARSGREALVRALGAERRLLRPENRWAREVEARLAARASTMTAAE